MKQHKYLYMKALAAGLVLAFSANASAAVTAEEAKQLGTTLTEFGAVKGANADGSIPAYTGGVQKAPAGWTKESKTYVDPFKDDKPVVKIDSKNMSQYADLLTPGTKAMLSSFPDSYRVDVYPTRRSVWYPDWVKENTVKNATTAKLGGSIMGDAVIGAAQNNEPFAGIPFPIPKNGYEVMWNYFFHYTAAVTHTTASAYLVDTGGNLSKLPTPNEYYVHPWYEKTGKMRELTFNAVHGFSATQIDPPSAAGIVFLNYYMHDASDGGQKVWFYTPGQRRVRAAPEFAYDIPIAAYGGVLLWDEVHGFTGRMDRFDFKLVGKKELIVPYNVFGVTNGTVKDSIGPKHLTPESMRFEKRRVWVVDATRKPDARHVYSKRTFYIEEDCWCLVGTESYDNGGKLWRVGNLYTFPTYDVGGVNNDSWTFTDLIKGNYTVLNAVRGEPGNFVRSYTSHEGLPIKLTPQAVAAGSVR
ncbi:MAG: hypothetical protein CMN89_03045 [Sutterellaceae bacterium]|uniref:DUF1329 domain-containing protein n=1 Tax=Limnobacter sp. UBA7229 TaxID=1946762 RepID=UPI000C4F7A05|nr:DUF1329 domain-containing protein [Limnobacter sp. UBA7229]MAG81396.1 hypothetical protein [Sutterellaceae bacterium]MBT83444.1 hypothetical protein [Sutterellaceae bacterium]|tara:strand:+ start:22394 stop:23803 length:1410 start_codon:yes stop_codon:yes gene_type:complete